MERARQQLDQANRSFVALLAIPCLVLGPVRGAIVALIVYLAIDGLGVAGSANGAVGTALLVVLALMGVGALRLAWSLAAQLRSTGRLRVDLRCSRLPLWPSLEQAAERAGLAGRVELVDDPSSFSFVYGLLSPRVVLSQGLFSSASGEELDAVLEHEGYHVRNLDPLKAVVSEALAQGFFYLPVIPHLGRRYRAGRELAADRTAVRSCGQGALAGALFKAVNAPRCTKLASVAAIGGADLLDARVTQLETGEEPAGPGLSRRAALVSVVGFNLLVLGVLVALVGVRQVASSDEASMSIPALVVVGAVGALACPALWTGVAWVVRRKVRLTELCPVRRRRSGVSNTG